MTPNIHINMLAIIIAVIANFILGFLWYTPIFGRAWRKEMGINPDEKAPAAAMVKGTPEIWAPLPGKIKPGNYFLSIPVIIWQRF